MRPLVDHLLTETGVDLLSCTLDEADACVLAEWRMTGSFNLPWRPKLDLQGRTQFTFDAAEGNRVVRYDETWNVSAAQALLQLLKPGRAA